MPEPLIPDDVRAMYEALIEEGSRLLPDDVSDNEDRIAATLSEIGLAVVARRKPPLLLPASPNAAFARLLAQWHAAIVGTAHRLAVAVSNAIKFERASLRTASQRANSTCTLIVSHEHALGLHHALTFSASSLLREWSTGPYGTPRTLPTGEPHPVGSLYFTSAPNQRGVQHLLIYDEPFLEDDAGLDDMVAGYAAGEEIRLIQEKLPMKLLIVDDDTALVPLGPYGHPCLLVYDKALVKLFVTFFELKWVQATPWAPPGTPVAEKENSQRQRILDALAEGLKDEAIARQQGISVRTVRRHIAAIMDELGVTTRFAAGVAAVRRGWLSPAA